MVWVHADLSTDAGRLKVTNNTSSDSGLVYLDVDTVVGKKYSLRVSIDIGTSLEASLRVYNGAGFTDQNTFVNKDTSGTYYLQFNAESSTSRIALQNNSTTNEQYSFFDSINLKQTTELITNGDFSAGDDGSWVVGSESIATFTNNQLTISGTRVGGPFVSQILNLIAGQKYTFEFDVDSMTATTTAVYLGPSANGIIVTSAGKYSYTFVYDTSMYPYLYLLCNNNGNVVFNSVSFRPAVEDRSVNNNGLQVIGEINKTKVAPGADLVAYSGFSANNYLVQPYNEDLDFGTGDFCVMGWFNTQQTSTNAYDDLLSIGDIGTTGYGAWSEGGLVIQHRTDNNKFLSYLSTPSNETSISLPQPYYPPNTWNHSVIRREAGLVSVLLNATQLRGYLLNIILISQETTTQIGNFQLVIVEIIMSIQQIILNLHYLESLQPLQPPLKSPKFIAMRKRFFKMVRSQHCMAQVIA